jgi:dienelactone hydrolase
MTRARRVVILLLLVAVLGAGVAGLRYGAALALSTALALPAAGGWLPLPAPPAPVEVAIDSPVGVLRADLYRPAAARGALVLVHGLSRAGRRQPDLARLAGLLARHGQAVLVPDLPGLVAFRLDGGEAAAIRAGAEWLGARHARVAIAGFSFGAGPALIAAAELPRVRLAASFGGYAELADVIAYVTTGAPRVGAAPQGPRPEDYNRWKLLAALAGFVPGAGERAALAALAARKLADPGTDTAALEAGLGPGAAATLALVANRRPEAVRERLHALPAEARAAMRRLSPLEAARRLGPRLLVAHGAADPSIPYTESLRLAEAAGAPAAIFRGFHHTGPAGGWRALADHGHDAWLLLGVADRLLAGR